MDVDIFWRQFVPTHGMTGLSTAVCVWLQGASYLGAGSEGDGDADQRGPGLQRTLLQIPPAGRSGGHRVMTVLIQRQPVPKTHPFNRQAVPKTHHYSKTSTKKQECCKAVQLTERKGGFMEACNILFNYFHIHFWPCPSSHFKKRFFSQKPTQNVCLPHPVLDKKQQDFCPLHPFV